MAFSIKPAEVYAADIMNRPGTLARVLEALAAAGANLEFVIARQVNENTSRVFVAPLRGKKVLAAAADVGLAPAAGMHVVRVEGPDRPGLGAKMTRALAAAGLNIRGLSAGTTRKGNLCYIAFARPADQKLALTTLKKALSARAKK